MFGNKRARKFRIPVSKDDIKQAIKRANDRLKAQNNKIEDTISSGKANLKSIQSEAKQAGKKLKNITSKIDSRISECTAVESQLMYLKDDFSSLTKKFEKELDIEESLRDSINALTKDESKLSKSVDTLEQKKLDTSSINASLKAGRQEYDQIKKDLISIRSDAENAKKAMSALKISKDMVQNEYSQACEKLGRLKSQTDSEVKNLELILSEKKEYFEVETTRLDRLIADRIEELADNTDLANNKLREYESILAKVLLAERKIAQTEIKVKEILANKDKEIDRIKERFQTWKLTQLDQVAKMKLKGKIENIDKAGLKDILDV